MVSWLTDHHVSKIIYESPTRYRKSLKISESKPSKGKWNMNIWVLYMQPQLKLCFFCRNSRRKNPWFFPFGWGHAPVELPNGWYKDLVKMQPVAGSLSCHNLSLRIQICPKKGISPRIPFWGWDGDHQSYSREGSGFLRYDNMNIIKSYQRFIQLITFMNCYWKKSLPWDISRESVKCFNFMQFHGIVSFSITDITVSFKYTIKYFNHPIESPKVIPSTAASRRCGGRPKVP